MVTPEAAAIRALVAALPGVLRPGDVLRQCGDSDRVAAALWWLVGRRLLTLDADWRLHPPRRVE